MKRKLMRLFNERAEEYIKDLSKILKDFNIFKYVNSIGNYTIGTGNTVVERAQIFFNIKTIDEYILITQVFESIRKQYNISISRAYNTAIYIVEITTNITFCCDAINWCSEEYKYG